MYKRCMNRIAINMYILVAQPVVAATLNFIQISDEFGTGRLEIELFPARKVPRALLKASHR